MIKQVGIVQKMLQPYAPGDSVVPDDQHKLIEADKDSPTWKNFKDIFEAGQAFAQRVAYVLVVMLVFRLIDASSSSLCLAVSSLGVV